MRARTRVLLWVCVCVFVYACVCVCFRLYVCVCVCAFMCVGDCVLLCVCVCSCLCVCVCFACMFVHVFVCVFLWMLVFLCVCFCVCLCVCVCVCVCAFCVFMCVFSHPLPVPWQLVPRIYKMFHLIFYHSGVSNYCFHLHGYIHNVSADMSSGLLRVFLTEHREPSRNFEPRPLFNPRGLLTLIPLTITGYQCYVFLYSYSELNLQPPDNCHLEA